ncbi:MAG: hypothetical protein JWM90_56 [Thermoleophilia bacterium]|nr:hypothetical protein [Thermoleophilia bacterium]
MSQFPDKARIDAALTDLGALLAERGAHHEVAIIGGAAFLLNGDGFARPTGDIDVAAGIVDGRISDREPIPEALAIAISEIGELHRLTPGWVSAAAANSFVNVLPDGFLARAHRRDYGGLVIQVASRTDLLRLKLNAAMRRGAVGDRHRADFLRARPTREELADAEAWLRSTEAPALHDRIATVVAAIHEALDA